MVGEPLRNTGAAVSYHTPVSSCVRGKFACAPWAHWHWPRAYAEAEHRATPVEGIDAWFFVLLHTCHWAALTIWARDPLQYPLSTFQTATRRVLVPSPPLLMSYHHPLLVLLCHRCRCRPAGRANVRNHLEPGLGPAYVCNNGICEEECVYISVHV